MLCLKVKVGDVGEGELGVGEMEVVELVVEVVVFVKGMKSVIRRSEWKSSGRGE